MNGNQGLEALASLCGGVSKARTQNDTRQNKSNNDDSTMMPPPTGHLMHPSVMNLQNHSISNKTPISQQQLYQAVLSAANANANAGANTNGNVNLFQSINSNLHQRTVQNSESTGLAYYNHLYNAQVAAQAMQLNAANQHQQNSGVFENNHNALEQQIAAALALASGSGTGLQQLRVRGSTGGSTTVDDQKQHAQQKSQSDQQRDSQSDTSSQHQLKNVIRRVPAINLPPQSNVFGGHTQVKQERKPDESIPLDDKKQVKRAANRRSAQLSRKRKKQFIEELKEENDDLRRKEQILRSIPDLVVVFDSAGKLGFVSQSVNRFLAFTSNELEGTSFWNRLCDESVRLLKAAFMDALAARKPGKDTAPLGDGLWELRLVDKDNKHKIVVLNGVVHFTGETPECVCSIRPTDDSSVQFLKASSNTKMKPPSSSQYIGPRDNIPPQQCVKSTSTTDDPTHMASKNKPRSLSKFKGRINPVSDGESVISENASISS